VLYDDLRDVEIQSDLFSYDLRSCQETVLAEGPGSQFIGFIWDSRVVYSAPSAVDPAHNALWLRDLTASSPVELPDTLRPHFPSGFNGRHVLLDKSVTTAADAPTHVELYDVQTMSGVVLQDLPAEDFSLSPTHGAWVAAGGPGWDVYYVELATLEVHHVESTYDPWVAHTSTWGDWLVWEDDRGPDHDV
jgi:hypothetical protein